LPVSQTKRNRKIGKDKHSKGESECKVIRRNMRPFDPPLISCARCLIDMRRV
jgi:hypothetical protein